MQLKDRKITYEFGGRTEVIGIDVGDSVCWVDKEKYEKDPLLMLYLEKIKIEKEIMENKYYTPEIEEFHVGFEFEMDDTWGGWMPLTLTEELLKNPSVSLGSGNDRTNYYLRTRVKYLDREDIKELGFELYKTHPGTTTHEFQSKDARYLITFDPEFGKSWNITISDENTPEFIFFHGFLKNKSELKKLMKQLGI